MQVTSIEESRDPVRIDRWQVRAGGQEAFFDVFSWLKDGVHVFWADGADQTIESTSLEDLRGKVLASLVSPEVATDTVRKALDRLAELAGHQSAEDMGTASFAATALDIILRESSLHLTCGEAKAILERQTASSIRFGELRWTRMIEGPDGVIQGRAEGSSAGDCPGSCRGSFLLFRDGSSLSFLESGTGSSLLPVPFDMARTLQRSEDPKTKLKVVVRDVAIERPEGDRIAIGFTKSFAAYPEIALPADLEALPDILLHPIRERILKAIEAHGIAAGLPTLRHPTDDEVEDGKITIIDPAGIWLDRGTGTTFLWPACLGHRRCTADVYEVHRQVLTELMEMMLWTDPGIDERTTVSLVGSTVPQQKEGSEAFRDVMSFHGITKRFSWLGPEFSMASLHLRQIASSALGNPVPQVAFDTGYDGTSGQAKPRTLLTVSAKRPSATRMAELEARHGKLFKTCEGYRDPGPEAAIQVKMGDVRRKSVVAFPAGGPLSRPGSRFKVGERVEAIWAGGVDAGRLTHALGAMKRRDSPVHPLDLYWETPGIFRDTFYGSLVLVEARPLGYASISGSFSPAVQDVSSSPDQVAVFDLNLSVDGVFVFAGAHAASVDDLLGLAIFKAVKAELDLICQKNPEPRRRLGLNIQVMGNKAGTREVAVLNRFKHHFASWKDPGLEIVSMLHVGGWTSPFEPPPEKPAQSLVWEGEFSRDAVRKPSYPDMFSSPICWKRSQGRHGELAECFLEELRSRLRTLGVEPVDLVLRELPMLEPEGRFNGGLTWMPRELLDIDSMVERQVQIAESGSYRGVSDLRGILDGQRYTLELLEQVSEADDILALWTIAALVPVLISGRSRTEGLDRTMNGADGERLHSYLEVPPGRRFRAGFTDEECMTLACEVLGWKRRQLASIWSGFSTDALPESTAIIHHEKIQRGHFEHGLPMLDYLAGVIARSALTHVPVRIQSCREAPSPEIGRMIEERVREKRRTREAAQVRHEAERRRVAGLTSLERRYEALHPHWRDRFEPGQGAELASGTPAGDAAILKLSTTVPVETLSVFLGQSAEKTRKLIDELTAAELARRGFAVPALARTRKRGFGLATLASYSDEDLLLLRCRFGGPRLAEMLGVAPGELSRRIGAAREACFGGMVLPSKWHHLLEPLTLH